MDMEDLWAEVDEDEGKQEGTKRLARVINIIMLISNAPRYWTRGKLAEKFEMGGRQIDKDLHMIRHGLRYEIARSREGYYFTRAPELRAIQYTTPEALALIGALHLARGTGAIGSVRFGSTRWLRGAVGAG